MTSVGPQWRDVFDLVAASEERILGGLRDIKEGMSSLGARVDALENTAERRTGSQTTSTFFLGLPGRVIGLLGSAAALVLGLAGVWALMGKF